MKLTGIVLAGGKSSRMGQDKGLMEFQGKPMVQHSIDLLKHFTDQIIISSNNPEYKKFSLPLITDKYKDCGPAGGLQAALSASKTEWNLIISCDVPFVIPLLFSWMIPLIKNQDVIIPKHNNKTEPLSAIYNKRMASFFEEKIKTNNLKLQNILLEKNISFFDASEIIKNTPRIFTNINTAEDLKT